MTDAPDLKSEPAVSSIRDQSLGIIQSEERKTNKPPQQPSPNSRPSSHSAEAEAGKNGVWQDVKALIDRHVNHDSVCTLHLTAVPEDLTIYALRYVQEIYVSVRPVGLDLYDEVIKEGEVGEDAIAMIEDEKIGQMSVGERRQQLLVVMQSIVDVYKSAIASKKLDRNYNGPAEIMRYVK